MEIIRNSSNHSGFLSTIRASKDNLLRKEEKDLLRQVSETLTIVYGGQFKKNNQSA